MATPFTTLVRDPGSVHPTMVEHFKPKEKILAPNKGTASDYAGLKDDSTYSEYAWEFLRRNRFYQAMVDGNRPAFDLAEWGYRPTPAHEPGFGLRRVKHYTERHDDSPPHWEPFAAMEDRLRHTRRHFKHHRPTIEYPGAQVAVVFDLAPVFGPGTCALQKQADFAVKYLERLRKKYVPQEFTASHIEAINQPTKKLLRGYLKLADLVSHPQAQLSEGKEDQPEHKGRARPGIITIKQAATMLPDYYLPVKKQESITDAKRDDAAYRFADEAWKHIYGWECLCLLKFQDWEPPPLENEAPL